MQKIARAVRRVARSTSAVASVPLLVPLAIVGVVLFRMEGVSSQVQRRVTRAQDPGVRAGAVGAGAPIAGLTAREQDYFLAGKGEFEEAEEVDEGLGPRLNLDSCLGCHSQPATGGTSPSVNPQVAFATKNGGTDVLPSFITANGPAREARFVLNRDGTADGGVHALFTITGRVGSGRCSLPQPDFERQVANRNVIFRIPTPTFGLGLVEQIPDSAITAGISDNGPTKSALGIRGRANFAVAGRTVSGQTNNNGNDGTVARFGWKAQNKSLLLFAGEAYNVEMGISNELFPTERDETPNCLLATHPNSITNPEATTTLESVSPIEKFAFFMRLLAPPTPSRDTPGGAPSIANGKSLFSAVGCTLCHAPSFTTGNSAITALRYKPVNLYSDLLLHDMGGLADGISQGQAGPSEFRTAPLWGLGQRIFFLHDGRTSDLVAAIRAHQSTRSEANAVIDGFQALSEDQKQDLLNFLRSL
ncbi:MAG: di-heme oxidoredictase family protein [Acidobacteriota bacterium]